MRLRSWTLLLLIMTASLAAILVFIIKGKDQLPADRLQIKVVQALGEKGTAGFARVLKVRPFVFPEDHGAHPDYKNEWWYFTGNLRSQSGRHFGFQLTFFRFALSPQKSGRSSRWGTNQVFMAHFAVTDVENRRFYNFERFSRGALDLAGAGSDPFRVWLEDWLAEGSADAFCPLHLRASQGDVGIDLALESSKPVVLQGDRGLSKKNGEPGNASYYYSLTRLLTKGRVRIGGESYIVEGVSWLDREWGTSALGDNQVGWDWFALQLSDGREVMLYLLRKEDGSLDPFSNGTTIAVDGSSRYLSLGDFEVEVLDRWRSPDGRARYPSRWRLRIPDEGVDLNIKPLVAEQEWQALVRYWEGAVQLQGKAGGKPVDGFGYVELTGYEDEQ